MQVPHDREHFKHLPGSSRGLPPVMSTKDDLGDLLSSTKAVVNSATSKALLPEAGVNAAAEVRLQIGTSLSGVFIDRKIHRG